MAQVLVSGETLLYTINSTGRRWDSNSGLCNLRAQTALDGVVALGYQHHHLNNKVPQLHATQFELVEKGLCRYHGYCCKCAKPSMAKW